MSLTWWGIASLSFVYAKGYGGLLALRWVWFSSSLARFQPIVYLYKGSTGNRRGRLLCWHDLLLVILVQKVPSIIFSSS